MGSLDPMPHSNDPKPGLIRGREMICPQCRCWSDVLAFRMMREVAFFSHATTPIYACPKCGFKFAPVERSIESIMLEATFKVTEVA